MCVFVCVCEEESKRKSSTELNSFLGVVLFADKQCVSESSDSHRLDFDECEGLSSHVESHAIIG